MGGGSYKKSLPWGRYGYFQELHNVSKGNMCIMGATIGLREDDLFKPYPLEIRESHVNKVDNFMNSDYHLICMRKITMSGN